MRYFVGVGLLAIGLALFYTGHVHKKRVLAAFADFTSRGEPLPEPPLNSLATFGEVMKFFILFILCGLALVVTLGYLLFDGGQYLSYFDITGALVAIAGYGFWVSMKTEHRMSDLNWPRPSEAATPSDEAQADEAQAADAPPDAQVTTLASADVGVAEPAPAETTAPAPAAAAAASASADEAPVDMTTTTTAAGTTAVKPTVAPAKKKAGSASSPARSGNRRGQRTRRSPRKP